jgi:hypothetical protein
MTDLLQFYPTPPALVRQLVAPYVRGEHEWERRIPGIILDPSAGMGDILGIVKREYGVRSNAPQTLLAIEPDLKGQMVLAGLGATLLAFDFFDYPAADRHIDFIFMNPPFRSGAKHLLHAWEIAPPGCQIACVLNEQTVANAHTNDRQVLERLIEEHGQVEDAGQPFLQAERPTDVRCVIVRLTKSVTAKVLDWDALNLEADETPIAPDPETFMENALARRGSTIAGLVQSYAAVRDLMAQRDALESSIKRILAGAQIHPAKSIQTDADLKAAYWEWVWRATTLGERTTSQFRKEFDALLASANSVAFNEENILRVLQAFVASAPDIMQQCIVGAFDAMTRYHAENRDRSAAWVTNDSYRIARRIILPWQQLYDDKYRYWHTWGFREADRLDDLDKAICFVVGEDYGAIERTSAAIAAQMRRLAERPGLDHREPFYSTFFRIRVFKKGAIHLDWRSEETWERFNYAAARYKNWLPDKTCGKSAGHAS